jgi:FkbM family methyltransferase
MTCAVNSWSQFGEDLLVWEMFGRAREGAFVEIGAHHPTHISQTYLLETQGWHGVLVEPQPRLAALLRESRPRSKVFEYAVVAPGRDSQAYLAIPSPSGASAYVTFEAPSTGRFERVKTATLDWILEQAGLAKVDYLSIDIENQELDALRGFNLEKYHPALILIEDHLLKLDKHRFLVRHGYRLVDRIGYNQWYVPLASRYPLRPRTGPFELFRKMYLSLPLRKLKFLLKARNRTPATPGPA